MEIKDKQTGNRELWYEWDVGDDKAAATLVIIFMHYLSIFCTFLARNERFRGFWKCDKWQLLFLFYFVITYLHAFQYFLLPAIVCLPGSFTHHLFSVVQSVFTPGCSLPVCQIVLLADQYSSHHCSLCCFIVFYLCLVLSLDSCLLLLHSAFLLAPCLLCLPGYNLELSKLFKLFWTSLCDPCVWVSLGSGLHKDKDFLKILCCLCKPVPPGLHFSNVFHGSEFQHRYS